MGIMLGNMTVEQIEARLGIRLSDEDREWMNASRQERVNNTPLEDGKWHCFDLPFIIMCGRKSDAKAMFDRLNAYKDQVKGSVSFSWERSDGE